MLTQDQWPWHGEFIVTLRDMRTGAEQVLEVPNRITTAGLNWLRDQMQSSSPSPLTEIALGTDGTAVQDSDAALYAEIAPRKSLVLSQPADGVSLGDAFWDDTEANVTIREIGLFAGAVLVARVVVNIPKTNQQSLTVTRQDTLTRS